MAELFKLKLNFIILCRASITTLGLLYEKLGRMAGRSYEETVQVLLRGLKNAESQTRAESLMTLEKVTITQINRFFSNH